MSAESTDYTFDPRWRFGLDKPPVVAASGISVSGGNGEERWQLPSLWCAHLYLYEVELLLDDVSHWIEPGCLSIVPPNIRLCYRYTKPGKHCFIHFREAPDTLLRAQVSPVSQLGARFEPTFTHISNAVAAQHAAPYRLTAGLWDLLCDSAATMETQSQPVAASIHPAVRSAKELIELQLGGPLCVEDLAAEVDVSQSYLAKLFRKSGHDTVAAYIVHRRTARAFHMLANTTMPIKAIAYSVGMPDLQHFNKAVRKAFGRSPRSIRTLGNE